MARRCVLLVWRWHKRQGYSGTFYGEAKCWREATHIWKSEGRDVQVCGGCKSKLEDVPRKHSTPRRSGLVFVKINESGGSK